MRIKNIKTLILILFLFCSGFVFANAGDLDSSFSGDGIVSYDIFGQSDFIFAIAQQQDGKIVGVGRSNGGGKSYGLIIRLNTDGTPDPTFNGGGVILETKVFGLNAILIQPDGKIVVGGMGAFFNDFYVLRYDTLGNLDPTFGDLGVAKTDFDTSSENIADMAF